MAKAFAQAHAKAIIITAREVSTLKSTEQLIKTIDPSIQVLPIAMEVTKEESVKAAFEQIKQKFGTVDVLVSNAGSLNVDQPISAADTSKWWGDFVSYSSLRDTGAQIVERMTDDIVQDVNVKGQMLSAKYFLQLLGSEKQGKIIIVSSAAGLITLPGSSSYTISKLVGMQLARTLSVENSNVLAVALHPGIVVTDMLSDVFRAFAKDTPLLAGAAAVWLATDAAKFLNGRYISANWDVVEMMARKAEIDGNDTLQVGLHGNFITATVEG